MLWVFSLAFLRRKTVFILTNELKSIRKLQRAGFSRRKAEALVSMLSDMKILTLSRQRDADNVLNTTEEEFFSKQDEILRSYCLTGEDKQAMFDFMQKESLELRQELVECVNEKFSKLQSDAKKFQKCLFNAVLLVGVSVSLFLSIIAMDICS